MLKLCIGIISWLPDKEPDRQQRVVRLNRLLKQLEEVTPTTDVLIIAQNWKDFKPVDIQNRLIVKYYDCLGILKARKTLREEFLKLSYDYIMMFDDDAILVTPGNTFQQYIQLMEMHPDGFCFVKRNAPLKYNPFADSQLNFCAISRYIYRAEEFPNVDAQNNEGYEDRVYSCLLYTKYKQFFFEAPEGLYCNHFKNPQEYVPSTWSRQKRFDWQRLSQNTELIEKYIVEHRELPKTLLNNLGAPQPGIDIVVPYVDSLDTNWQKLFEEYNPKTVSEGVNAKNRFRGQGDFFKYFFRGIDKYMPWVRKVHLVVQSESQVPTWINKDKVHNVQVIQDLDKDNHHHLFHIQN